MALTPVQLRKRATFASTMATPRDTQDDPTVPSIVDKSEDLRECSPNDGASVPAQASMVAPSTRGIGATIAGMPNEVMVGIMAQVLSKPTNIKTMRLVNRHFNSFITSSKASLIYSAASIHYPIATALSKTDRWTMASRTMLWLSYLQDSTKSTTEVISFLQPRLAALAEQRPCDASKQEAEEKMTAGCEVGLHLLDQLRGKAAYARERFIDSLPSALLLRMGMACYLFSETLLNHGVAHSFDTVLVKRLVYWSVASGRIHIMSRVLKQYTPGELSQHEAQEAGHATRQFFEMLYTLMARNDILDFKGRTDLRLKQRLESYMGQEAEPEVLEAMMAERLLTEKLGAAAILEMLRAVAITMALHRDTGY